MHVIVGGLGIALAAIAIADAIQTVIVARHARKLPAITRLFYRLTWPPFVACAWFIPSGWRRHKYLGIYGPVSLLLLLGLWAVSLIVAFAMLQWALGLQRDGIPRGFSGDVYFSAASFFTLGAGEPGNSASRYLMVLEAGFGYSFLGLVIGYLPVLYQSFSEREVRILMLDARAGTPPTALQFVLRRGGDPAKLEKRLAEWEEWALDLLQEHLSYPMLAFYRSQHANQSWLAALTTVVDVSALAMLGAGGDLQRQARFTFAAARHALVHTASIFDTRPAAGMGERLCAADFSRLCDIVSGTQTPLQAERISQVELSRLRSMYEPAAIDLGSYFCMELPPWIPAEQAAENWQISSWDF